LALLAADRKNEIWMVTYGPMDKIEETYGQIQNLHLAGLNGIQFSKGNTASVKLPDVGSTMEKTEAKALEIILSMPRFISIISSEL
jgi:trehalose-6-phosphatase